MYRPALTSGNRCYFLRGPRCLKSLISLLPLHAGTSLSAVAQRQPCHQNLDNSSSVSAPALPGAISVQYLRHVRVCTPTACSLDSQKLATICKACKESRLVVKWVILAGDSLFLSVDPGLSETTLKSLRRFSLQGSCFTCDTFAGAEMSLGWQRPPCNLRAEIGDSPVVLK